MTDDDAEHERTYDLLRNGTDQPTWADLPEETREKVRVINRKFWGWYKQYGKLVGEGKTKEALQFAESVVQQECEQAKDPLFLLLNATTDPLFERLAPKWPGIETMRNLVWDCVCGEPDCFRHCVQAYSKQFPSPELFEEWLGDITVAVNLEDITDITHAFCKKHGIASSQLMRDAEEPKKALN